MNPPRGSGRRLSVDDWIQAGFSILAEGDPAALRVERLCERLRVTKGSFYWHFSVLHGSNPDVDAPSALSERFLDFVLRP